MGAEQEQNGSSLEPTYKGLKLGGVMRLNDHPASLEPTYKGLKSSFFLSFWFLPHPRLEPTYKGLKYGLESIYQGTSVLFRAYL